MLPGLQNNPFVIDVAPPQEQAKQEPDFMEALASSIASSEFGGQGKEQELAESSEVSAQDFSQAFDFIKGVFSGG